MKNAIMMVAAMGMFGGALADQSTSVDQIVTAQVSNVCTYAVNDQTDVDGLTFKSHPSKDIGPYNALASKDSSIPMNDFFIFRCTSGTSWDTMDFAKSGKLPLMGQSLSNTGKTLNALYTVTTGLQLDTLDGDIHTAGLLFTIPAGQWQSSAGSYKGTLTVKINYN